MELSSTSDNRSLNKNTYVNLRWIGIIGQFIAISIVNFILKFEFNYILSNTVIYSHKFWFVCFLCCCCPFVSESVCSLFVSLFVWRVVVVFCGCTFGCGSALRVPPAETRLTVYRRLQITEAVRASFQNRGVSNNR